ncbi:hypothetical protein FNF29_07273 [Cafeteria roenbergensis]|uniref:Uncharacterized protein n=1 Tax=Cafeteria roenbergensis TaxID=33653 RepID=A0A5A8C3N1_CAFRO|nr:hypothetical protein FNF29_07273 [Cafeteria roenbergensis]|eukprot:KAA0147528.1 hypothetical protein FNF29_07273 [Cafeteria roenbergensis]
MGSPDCGSVAASESSDGAMGLGAPFDSRFGVAAAEGHDAPDSCDSRAHCPDSADGRSGIPASLVTAADGQVYIVPGSGRGPRMYSVFVDPPSSDRDRERARRALASP